MANEDEMDPMVLVVHVPDSTVDGRVLPPSEAILIRSEIVGWLPPVEGNEFPRLLLRGGQEIRVTETWQRIAVEMGWAFDSVLVKIADERENADA